MIQRLAIPDVWTYTPRRFEDQRGWLSETFNAEAMAGALKDVGFVQDNQSFSRSRSTLRGLHFQIPPKAQDKLVRVLRGAVLDIAVDLRRSSATFGRWVGEELSAANGVQLFVPKGFAHGFITLEHNTEVLYRISDYYSPEHERGVLWSDPTIGVEWRAPADEVVIVARDQAFPRLADLPAFF